MRPNLESCRVCDGHRLELAVDLGEQPWANHFLRPEEAGNEPFYPLRVLHCQDCRTAQLDYTVPKETLFGDHTYLSGVTQTLRSHFAGIAREVDRTFNPRGEKRAVLDIGSNDGTQLSCFLELGYDVLGVESSATTARIANQRGIETMHAFFNLETARTLERRFDVINAAGVFFHLEELHSVTDGIRTCLNDDGVFVVQFLYMKRIAENLAFDQIYHEHLLYYTLESISALLERHGLELFDAYVSPVHGGSVIGFVTHKGTRSPSDRLGALRRAERAAATNDLDTYRRFARDIEVTKARDLEFLEAARNAGRSVFGFGAPVKGNTLLNTFGIDRSLIQCLVEKNELRRGLVSPGRHIPVVIEGEFTGSPDVYYVLAWNFKREILRNNQKLIDDGVQFYFPVDPEDA